MTRSPKSEFIGADGRLIPSLPDYLQQHLKLVSIGLNPSINSVRAGYYFATPTNRFWKALNGSELIGETIAPGVDGIERLFQQYRIGFTDVVKRATAGAADLRAADFRYWSPLLEEKITGYQPRIAWFHGKVAYQRFLKATGRDAVEIDWGRQPLVIGHSNIFVTPNPSPANAVFSLQDLIRYYNELAVLLRQIEDRSLSDAIE
jgi:double-stranded uracil-DNA glycosylase